MRTTTLLLVLMLAAAASGTAAPRAGSPAQGEKTQAALKAEAEKGDARAQLAYAKALTPHPDARAWAQKAADQGLAEAWFWLGYTMNGNATPFYEKAAALGHTEAFSYLFDLLLFRAGPDADVVKARKFADLARKTGVEGDADTFTTIDRCFDAGAPVIPAADQPTPEERATLGRTDCALLQASSGMPGLRKYRACLLSEPHIDNNLVAEIYANGWGVKRNPQLAIALVCHGSDVPAELESMVDALYRTRSQATLAEEFLFCDHVMSGRNQGLCAARAERVADAGRAGTWARMTAAWPAAHKAAFQTLRAAADTFFQTRATSEIDMSGTARAMLATSEESDLREAMVAAVQEFEAGKLPAPGDLKSADAELNAVYGAIMTTKDLGLGTVTSNTVRAAQRTWLPYRDAWAAFGVIRYPRVPADAWRAWATTVRVAQLKALLQAQE